MSSLQKMSSFAKGGASNASSPAGRGWSSVATRVQNLLTSVILSFPFFYVVLEGGGTLWNHNADTTLAGSLFSKRVRRWTQTTLLVMGILMPAVLVTTTPLRHHWSSLDQSARQLSEYTDADILAGSSYAEAAAANSTSSQALHDAVLLWHTGLQQLHQRAQEAITRGPSCAVWEPRQWSWWSVWSPRAVARAALSDVRAALALWAILALLASLDRCSMPLTLAALQLDLLLCLYCWRMQQASSAFTRAVEQIMSSDSALEGKGWPGSATAMMEQILLHLKLSRLADSWRGQGLTFDLPELPVVGKVELGPDLVIQAALTSAAGCVMNIVSAVLPEVTVFGLAKAAIDWATGLGGQAPKDTKADKRPLFEKLGGSAAVELAVEGVYKRILDDPLLSEFFNKTNMEYLKRKMGMFLTSAFGGPVQYTGLTVRGIHLDMVVRRGLGRPHFDAVVGHLLGTLSDLGVQVNLMAEVTFTVAGLRDAFQPPTHLETVTLLFGDAGQAIVQDVATAALASDGEDSGGQGVAQTLAPVRSLLEQLRDSKQASANVAKGVATLLQQAQQQQQAGGGAASLDDRWDGIAHQLRCRGVGVGQFDALSQLGAAVFGRAFHDRDIQLFDAALQALLPLRKLLLLQAAQRSDSPSP